MENKYKPQRELEVKRDVEMKRNACLFCESSECTYPRAVVSKRLGPLRLQLLRCLSAVDLLLLMLPPRLESAHVARAARHIANPAIGIVGLVLEDAQVSHLEPRRIVHGNFEVE